MMQNHVFWRESKNMNRQTMSAATAPIDILLGLDLDDLYSAHECSKWMRMLPHYKTCYSSVIEVPANIIEADRDMKCCDEISRFISQERLNGKLFKRDFNEKDFQSMLQCIFPSKSDYECSAVWIWKIIEFLQKK